MSQYDEVRLAGGSVGGAVRVGGTVRRPTGPWTPAVHALLDQLATRVPNVPCVLGHDEFVGVFDWDLSGSSTPLLELAFIAWNCVPLWRDIGPGTAAERLRVIAEVYGTLSARQILHAIPRRIQIMLDGIPAAAAAGDEGMANLMTAGEPGRSSNALAGLIHRIRAIDRQLT
jgi:hypothetical protein